MATIFDYLKAPIEIALYQDSGAWQMTGVYSQHALVASLSDTSGAMAEAEVYANSNGYTFSWLHWIYNGGPSGNGFLMQAITTN